MNLTPKQRDLLIYLNGYIQEHSCAPSYDEMTVAMSLASKSGINRLIVGLEERGFVRRLKHRARAIDVLRMPGEPTRAIPPDTERDTLKAFVREIAHDEPDLWAMRRKAQRLLERFP